MLETYGPHLPLFYGQGEDDELDQLERLTESTAAVGKDVQVIWCKCPLNALLRVPHLLRLRKPADRYGFVLVVDDTIGTFGNVNLLGVTDVIDQEIYWAPQHDRREVWLFCSSFILT